MKPKEDPIRTLSEEEVREITRGGLSRVIPVVKLFDMLKGRPRPAEPKEKSGRP